MASSRLQEYLLANPMYGMGANVAKNGTSTEPVRSPFEGIARALQGGIGGLMQGYAMSEAKDQVKGENTALVTLLEAQRKNPTGALPPDIIEKAGGHPMLSTILSARMTAQDKITAAAEAARLAEEGRRERADQNNQFKIMLKGMGGRDPEAAADAAIRRQNAINDHKAEITQRAEQEYIRQQNSQLPGFQPTPAPAVPAPAQGADDTMLAPGLPPQAAPPPAAPPIQRASADTLDLTGDNTVLVGGDGPDAKDKRVDVSGLKVHPAYLSRVLSATTRVDREHAMSRMQDEATNFAKERTPSGYTRVGGVLQYEKGGPNDPAVRQEQRVLKAIPAPENDKLSLNSALISNLDKTMGIYGNPQSPLKPSGQVAGWLSGTGKIGDLIAQNTDPDGVAARALLADVRAILVQAKSGQAVTEGEFNRLMAALPDASNTPEAIKTRLKLLRETYGSVLADQAAQYTKENGYIPHSGVQRVLSGAPQAAPGAAPQQAPTPGAAAPSGIPQGAIDMLKANPGSAQQFEQTFGPGSAARILGR